MGWPILISIMMTQMTSLSSIELSLMGLSYNLGLFIGCFIFPYMSDIYGRSYIFRRTILLVTIATMILTVSTSYYLILAMLVPIGIGLGGEMTLYGAVMIESSPPSRKGVVSLLTLTGCAGVAIFVSIAIALEVTWNYEIARWRVMNFVLMIFVACAYWLRGYMLESPIYLHGKGSYEYKSVLYRIAQINGKEHLYDVSGPLMEDIEVGYAQSPVKVTSSILDILKGEHLYTTVFLTLAHSIGNFSATGFLIMLPLFLPIKTQVEIYSIILIQQVCGVPGMFIASKLIDSSLGRRWTTALGYLLTAVSIFPFICYTDFFIIISSAAIYNMMLQWGTAGILSITPESFPPSIRGSGVGFVFCMSRLTGLISPPVTGLLLDWIGVGGTISIYMSCLILQSFFCSMLRETRQKI